MTKLNEIKQNLPQSEQSVLSNLVTRYKAHKEAWSKAKKSLNRMESSKPLNVTCIGSLKGLGKIKLEFEDNAAVCVVLASGGYPKSYQKGYPITGIADARAAGCQVFHAGTAIKDGQLVNNGGRVLDVVATAPTIHAAVDKAYAGIARVQFQDSFYRKDIAHRALAREQ